MKEKNQLKKPLLCFFLLFFDKLLYFLIQLYSYLEKANRYSLNFGCQQENL